MKTTSADTKSIRAKISSMIDNQYYATLAMVKEQNDALPEQLSENELEMTAYFAHQIVHNKEATIGYVLELRESLNEAINNPRELKRTLRQLRNEAYQSGNELIFDMFSDVIEYIDEVGYVTTTDEVTTHFRHDQKDIRKAA